MPGTTALTSAIVFFAVFGLLHSKGASDPADYCTEKKKEQQEYLIAKQTVEHILGIDHQKQVEEKKQEKEEQR